MDRVAPSLLALLLANSLPGTAAAQTLPAVELRALGSALPAEISVRSFNCIGRPGPGLNLLDGTTTVTPGLFAPTTGAGLDCRVDEIQPDFEGRFVIRPAITATVTWRKLASVQSAFGSWPNIQLALADRLPDADDFDGYQGGAGSVAGPAIVVPFYVVPIALAYNPAYGVAANGQPLNFNVRATNITRDPFGNPTGGLRLSRGAYCRILNGEIINWNDPALRALNGNLTLQSPNDDPGRWTSEGAPIRLVGQLDTGGATNMLARHLASVCTPLVALNKFVRAADALPYNSNGGVDMRVYGSTAAYFPGAAPEGFAGKVTMISGAHYNPATDSILTTAGRESPGLFMTAPGPAGVAAAIASQSAGTLVASVFAPGVRLDGKFGYVPGDHVRSSAGRTLFSAALQQATGTIYLAPTATHAGTALATVLPPQTTAGTGAWNVNDPRVNSVTGRPLQRANPADWFDVLYANPARSLASPVSGYPITGTVNLYTYSCFASQARQLGIGQFAGVLLGNVTRRADGTALAATTFRGVGPQAYGILPQSNLNTVPGAWATAIIETFLRDSNQQSTPAGGAPLRLGDEKLWIQSRIPTRATDIDGDPDNGEAEPNPGCSTGIGA